MRESHPGARASRPHKSWYSLTHLLDPDRTATAPWLCFGRDHAISTRRSGGLPHRRETERQPKGSHAGETPALPGGAIPMARWGGIRRATSLRADGRRLGNSRLSVSPASAVPCGSNQSVTIRNRRSLCSLCIPSRFNLNALVALRRSSWPFVDNSFFFCFRQAKLSPPDWDPTGFPGFPPRDWPNGSRQRTHLPAG